LFKGSGETVTPEKLGAAKALVSFGIPVSKESIEDLIRTAKQVDTFKGLIEADLVKLSDIPPKSPVKQILIAHYSQASPESTQNEADLSRLLNGTGTTQNSVVQNQNESQQLVTETSSETSKETILPNQEEVLTQKLHVEEQAGKGLKTNQDSNQLSAQNETLKATGQLLELLEKVDFQKLAFHKGSNMNASIQNLAMLDKLIFGNEPIGKQLEDLIQTIQQSADKLPENVKNLLRNLEGLGLKDDDKLDESLSKLISTLEMSSEDGKENALDQMKNQLTTVQQSVNYMRDLNENMSYVQLPLLVNDEMRSVDFFVKKRNKNDKENDETTIFISLDTKVLNTVQVLVEYKSQDVDIQFRLSDQDVLDLLSENQVELNDKLTEISDKNVQLQFRLKEQTQTTLDVIAEMSASTTSAIDLKV